MRYTLLELVWIMDGVAFLSDSVSRSANCMQQASVEVVV